jgi:hypothetical protein
MAHRIGGDAGRRHCCLENAAREAHGRRPFGPASHQGWGSIRDQADWDKAVEDADKGFDRGLFLLERLGAERYLDPQLMAVLLVLRRRLVDETGAHTALEFMLIDSAVMAYYHQLRINGWIGNFGALLESEFFGKKSLTAKLKGYYGSDNVRGLRVEDIVHRLGVGAVPPAGSGQSFDASQP